MAWLVSDAHVLSSAEVADGRRARRRGLIGRESVEGAFIIEGCKWVHTVGMKFPIDIAYLDASSTVISIEQMKPHRVGAPIKGATTVVEAEAGAFGRWGLQVGDQLEIRTTADDPPGAA